MIVKEKINMNITINDDINGKFLKLIFYFRYGKHKFNRL